MAGVQGQVTNSAAQALAAATAETVLQIVAAANHPVKVLGISATFDGASTTAVPAIVEWRIQSTAGTSSAVTPTKRNNDSGVTLQTTAREAFTAEPTDTNAGEKYHCHPQQGLVLFYPLGQEPIVPAGARFGLRITAPAVVNALCSIIFEE